MKYHILHDFRYFSLFKENALIILKIFKLLIVLFAVTVVAHGFI